MSVPHEVHVVARHKEGVLVLLFLQSNEAFFGKFGEIGKEYGGIDRLVYMATKQTKIT